EQLENLRGAYHILKHNVIHTLRTQREAEMQFNRQINEVLHFSAAVQLHCKIVPGTELAMVEQSLTAMVDAFTEARHLSSDPPTGPTLVVTSRSSSGGWPRVDIDPRILSEALNLRGPSYLQEVFHVCAQTIRRRAFEYGLAEPRLPVSTDTLHADGTILHTYTSTSAPVSTISDADLDLLLASILQTFPKFGHRMLKGCLRVLGH
ncbi:hypothetical protein B0H14DRAFT_2246371, partial [Mycena olivaceomarginata]